jgi:hypothetical protein
MAVVTFDTFEILEKLKGVGFSQDQARATIEAIASSHANPNTVNQANFREYKAEVKANIGQQESKVLHAIECLRASTDSKLEVLQKDVNSTLEIFRKDIDSKLEKLSLQLTIRLGGMVIAGATLIIGAFSFILRYFLTNSGSI